MVISTNKPTINKSQWLCFLAVLKHVDRLRVIPFIWTVSERVWNFKLCISLWHYHSIGIGIMMKQIIIGLDPSPFKPCLVPMGYTNISWTETVRLCGTPCGFNSSSKYSWYLGSTWENLWKKLLPCAVPSNALDFSECPIMGCTSPQETRQHNPLYIYTSKNI